MGRYPMRLLPTRKSTAFSERFHFSRRVLCRSETASLGRGPPFANSTLVVHGWVACCCGTTLAEQRNLRSLASITLVGVCDSLNASEINVSILSRNAEVRIQMFSPSSGKFWLTQSPPESLFIAFPNPSCRSGRFI